MTRAAWTCLSQSPSETGGGGSSRRDLKQGLAHAVADGENHTLCGLQVDNDYREPWPCLDPACPACVRRERVAALMQTEF
jgi:hypothetical protein